MNIDFSQFATKTYWQEFITSDFWFSVDRVRIRYIDWTIGYFGLALIIAAIVVWFMKRKKAANPHSKKLLERYFNFLLTIGLLLGFWFALRWQNGVFFGSKFVAGLILLSGIIWLVYILKYQFKKHGAVIADWEKEQQRLKYLPGSKK